MQKRIEFFFKNHKIKPLQQNARSYIFDCPACGGSKKLYIEKESGRSVCFKKKSSKCPGAGSRITYTLSLLSGISIEAVKREIFDLVVQLTDEINVSFEDNDEVERKELKAGSLPLDVHFIQMSGAEEGVEYLNNRGISKDVAKKYKILYSPVMRRVLFPVIIGKTLYGWQGRAIDKVDKGSRMHNMKGDWRSRTLMFYENIVDKKFAIIAEGPIDAMKFEQVGHFVATMGKEISNDQLELLRKSKIEKIYLALDRDAFDKIERIRNNVTNAMNGKTMKCYIIEVPEHRGDFGECTFDECKKAFQSAKEITGDEIFASIEIKGG